MNCSEQLIAGINEHVTLNKLSIVSDFINFVLHQIRRFSDINNIVYALYIRARFHEIIAQRLFNDNY